jgi:hypothetical protein
VDNYRLINSRQHPPRAGTDQSTAEGTSPQRHPQPVDNSPTPTPEEALLEELEADQDRLAERLEDEAGAENVR